MGVAVGELERQRERVDRRAMPPVVNRRAGLRGHLNHRGQRDEREWAWEQRGLWRGAGGVSVCVARHRR